jgi:integrase
MLALTTGMRRGEILGVRWQDVDLKRKLIVLNKTKNRDRRSVPIVPAVAELLQQHGKVRRLDTELVFPARPTNRKDGKLAIVQTGGDDAGTPKEIGPLWFDEWWYEALKAAKIEDFRFNDLRHTAASYLAMSGATTAEDRRCARASERCKWSSGMRTCRTSTTGAVVERMTRKYFA